MEQNNTIKKSASLTTRKIIAYVVLVLITILCLFWFYVLLINATRSNGDIVANAFSLKPGASVINNFKKVLNDGSIPIIAGLRNSFIIAALSALLCVYFSTMTAYAIHAYEFKLKGFLFTFILMIMMIPTQVTTLGFIDWMETFGLENTFIPLILPAISSPVTFFYLKQYMESALPLELVEAARIDGSGEFKTFNRIVLPLMKPAIAVQAIFSFVSSWNNYFVPSHILTEKEVKTLPILLAQIRSESNAQKDQGKIYMSIALSIFPVIIVYLVLSKHIVQGVALGSVKG